MTASIEELNQTHSKIYEILGRHFPSKKDEEYTPASTLAAFNEIEALGPIALDSVTLLQRDERLLKVFVTVGENGLKYLEYAGKKEEIGLARIEENGRQAMEALAKVGLPALPILKDILEKSSIIEKRRYAAQYIAGIEGGLDILVKAATSSDEMLRKASILGTFHYIYFRYINSNPRFYNQRFFPPEVEPFLEFVHPALEDNDAEIRSEAIRYLSDVERISIDEIAKGSEDTNPRVRNTALEALLRMDINKTNAHIFVHFLEDQVGEISKAVIERLNKPNYTEIEEGSVANAIIEEIIIRKSHRPEKYFNPQITASSFEPLFEKNPHLYEFVHLTLRDLAFNEDKGVSERAIKVGDALNFDYFKQLIRQKAEEFPEKSSRILFRLGDTGNLPSITNSLNNYTNTLKDLEDESIKRWREITKQSKIDYWVRMILTIIFFIAALIIIGIGLWLLVTSKDILTQGIGLALSSITTIGGMLSNFWKESIGDIKNSQLQQAGIEAAFISFMTQNGQIRLVFSKKYETGEITLDELNVYQSLASTNRQNFTDSLLLIQDRKTIGNLREAKNQ